VHDRKDAAARGDKSGWQSGSSHGVPSALRHAGLADGGEGGGDASREALVEIRRAEMEAALADARS
jgi:hypothetical protein